MPDWDKLCWNGGDCHDHDPYLPPGVKAGIITAHICVYPVICYGLYVLSNRATDLKRVGANFEFLFYGFITLVIQTDFFIADHINSMWIAEPETTTLDHIGYTTIVTSNCLLALGFAGFDIRSIFCCQKRKNPYKVKVYDQDELLLSPTSYGSANNEEDNNKCSCCDCFERFKGGMYGAIALAMIIVTAGVYDYCKTMAVAMTMVSGIWCVNNLKLTLGSGIFVYIAFGVTAVIIGGTLTGVMNWLCLQWLHIIIASCFAIQGAAISLAIKNFDIIGAGDNRKNEEKKYLTVNDSI